MGRSTRQRCPDTRLPVQAVRRISSLFSRCGSTPREHNLFMRRLTPGESDIRLQRRLLREAEESGYWEIEQARTSPETRRTRLFGLRGDTTCHFWPPGKFDVDGETKDSGNEGDSATELTESIGDTSGRLDADLVRTRADTSIRSEWR